MNSGIDLIALGTLIVTFLTALAAFLTILEVKKQRESAYYPELYIENQIVYIHGYDCRGMILPFNYTTEPIKEVIGKSPNDDVKIKLLNVGLAVAKEVKYEWKFDIERIIKYIDKVNKNGLFKMHYDGKLDISIPKIDYGFTHMVANQNRKQTINYILPSSIEKIPAAIPVPSSYIDLYLIYLSTSWKYYKEGEENKGHSKVLNLDIENFPALVLRMSYKDLHGKIHKKNFQLQFEHVIMRDPQSVSQSEAKGLAEQILTCTEIS